MKYIIVIILGILLSTNAVASKSVCYYKTDNGVCITKKNINVVEMISNVAKVISDGEVLLVKKISIKNKIITNAYMQSDDKINVKYCDISIDINYIVAADTLRQIKCP